MPNPKLLRAIQLARGIRPRAGFDNGGPAEDYRVLTGPEPMAEDEDYTLYSRRDLADAPRSIESGFQPTGAMRMRQTMRNMPRGDEPVTPSLFDDPNFYQLGKPEPVPATDAEVDMPGGTSFAVFGKSPLRAGPLNKVAATAPEQAGGPDFYQLPRPDAPAVAPLPKAQDVGPGRIGTRPSVVRPQARPDTRAYDAARAAAKQAWERYNQSEDPADFVRASNAMLAMEKAAKAPAAVAKGVVSGSRAAAAPVMSYASLQNMIGGASDRDLMIRTVIGEAAREPEAGKAAVAHVVKNRLNTGKWGDNIKSVLFAPKQFEPWMTRAKSLMSINPESPLYKSVGAIVDGVISGDIADPTKGAINFQNPAIVAQRGNKSGLSWLRRMYDNGTAIRIGNHVFGTAYPSREAGGRVGYATEGAVVAATDTASATEGAVVADTDTASAPATREQIQDIYQTQLGREADTGGLDYWDSTDLSYNDLMPHFYDSSMGSSQSATNDSYQPFAGYLEAQTAYNRSLLQGQPIGDIVSQKGQYLGYNQNSQNAIDNYLKNNEIAPGTITGSMGEFSGADARNLAAMMYGEARSGFGVNTDADAAAEAWNRATNYLQGNMQDALEPYKNITNFNKASEDYNRRVAERAGTNLSNFNQLGGHSFFIYGNEADRLAKFYEIPPVPPVRPPDVGSSAPGTIPVPPPRPDDLAIDFHAVEPTEPSGAYEFTPLDDVSSYTPNYDNYTVGLDTDYKSMPVFTNLSVNPSDYGSFSGSGDLGGASGLTTFSTDLNNYSNAGLNLGYGGNSWDGFGGWGFESYFADGGAAKGEEPEQPQRDLSPMGFYSHAAETAQNFPQAKGTPQQFNSMLRNAGVRPAEIENSGYDEAFADRPSVTRDEIAQHFKQSMPKIEETILSNKNNSSPYKTTREWDDAIAAAVQRGDWDEFDRINQAAGEDPGYGVEGTPKYSEYTLPGGENYREVLMRLPPTKNELPQFKVVGPDGHIDGTYDNAASAAERAAAVNGTVRQDPAVTYEGGFQSTHWDQPNVVAHLRLADRTGPNGEKILHLEELQSDWAQSGRKKGFKADGIPAAPYVTNTQHWTDLGLKRALTEAANGGYDKLMWTPGATQAKRYDLSQHVDEVRYMRNADGTYNVYPQKDGEEIMTKLKMKPEEVEELLGKDIAKKMTDTPAPDDAGFIFYNVTRGNRSERYPTKEAAHAAMLEFKAKYPSVKGSMMVSAVPAKQSKMQSISGVDLAVGGEGMKDYYDKIVPKALQKLASKHDKDAKIGRGRIAEVDAQSLDITPKMRESILRGQTAFADGGEVPPAAAPVKRRQLPVSQSPIANKALMVSSGSAPRLPGAGPLLRQLRGRPVS